MFRRVAALALLLAVALAPSCSSSKPMEPGHDCLQYWGQFADELIPMLDQQRAAHGLQWARNLKDAATFDALESLKQELEKALDRPLTTSTKENPGSIEQTPQLDQSRELAKRVRDGQPADPVHSGLWGDSNSGCHLEGVPQGWLNTVADGSGGFGPNLPTVTDKADLLLTKLREALDM